jgi:hypothetical protein
MNSTQAILIGLTVVAAVIVVFFWIFRGKGKFKIKTTLVEASAEGENSPPPLDIAGGVKIKGAEADGNIMASSGATGGVDLENVKAKGNIEASHNPDVSPPKH